MGPETGGIRRLEKEVKEKSTDEKSSECFLKALRKSRSPIELNGPRKKGNCGVDTPAPDGSRTPRIYSSVDSSEFNRDKLPEERL